MIYAVYDISADTWYMLGDYSTSVEVIEFYQTMCQAPFWKDRLSALYSIGSFDMNTGIITSYVPTRILVSGKNVSEITSVPEDSHSEGAGGEKPPVEQKVKVSKRFNIVRKIFGSVRND